MTDFLLTPEALSQLRQIARQVLGEIQGTNRDPAQGIGDASHLNCHIMKTTTGGISARSSNTPGSGTASIWYRSTGNTLTQLTTETLTVYNLSENSIAGEEYIKASQDLFGSLWADVNDVAIKCANLTSKLCSSDASATVTGGTTVKNKLGLAGSTGNAVIYARLDNDWEFVNVEHSQFNVVDDCRLTTGLDLQFRDKAITGIDPPTTCGPDAWVTCVEGTLCT